MKKHFLHKTEFKNIFLTTLVSPLVVMLVLCVMVHSTALAETVYVGKSSNAVDLEASRADGCVLNVTIGQFEQKAVEINSEKYFTVSLPKETLLKEKGSPELPTLSRSVSIPGDSGVVAKVVDSEYVDYKMPVAPSKGILSRAVSPEKVPFEFGTVYKEDRFYPKDIVSIGAPYLLREVRGVSVNISPLVYNPVRRILRVYTRMTISIQFEGQDDRNTLKRADAAFNPYFAPVYEQHFINVFGIQDILDILTADDVVMLVIADDDFTEEMQPFVDHKNDIGLTTKMVTMSEAGPTADDVQDYIQDYYDTHDSLTYVLLVGDHAQVPSPIYLGGGSDPSYALVSGADNYPDIFIGRFSAETEAQVNTMVQRSIHFETVSKGAWYHNGMGIASSQGTGDDGEYDYEHVRNINTVLYGWHYLDMGEFFDGSQGGDDAAGSPTAAAIATAVNNGVSIINYTGHGSTTSWSTSGFSNANVNNLVNDNELPFIFSVACVNGNFTGSTAFAETWLRATNGATGNPTGAIGFYGSTINQSWSPPMEAQDEFNNMLANEVYSSFGALCYNASAAMMDAYGAGIGASGTNMFLTWTLFGDPSLTVSPACFANLPNPVLKYKGSETYWVGGTQYTRYKLSVTNWGDYPNQLFDTAPYLAPCGANTNASRTWVDIYNAATDKRIYGFCAFDSNDDLTRIWFSVPKGTAAPTSVYVVLNDRHCETEYVSNDASTLLLAPVGFTIVK